MNKCPFNSAIKSSNSSDMSKCPFSSTAKTLNSGDINKCPFGSAIKSTLKFKQSLLANKGELSCWGLVLAAITYIYLVFSDGELSFSYTLSAISQVLGFVLIALKVQSTGSVGGLSLNTFICYSVSLSAKFFAIVFYDGYRPTDATGDVVFRLSEFIALLASLVMVYMIAGKFRSFYNRSIDKINYLYLVVPAFVLACLVHPTLNDIYYGDIAWTFSLYLEVVAMLPQLYMFSKKGGEVETFTSHFVASQALSYGFAALFWAHCYKEINESVGLSWTLFAQHTGYVIILCQAIQSLLFSEFLYEYVKSIRRGSPIIFSV